MIRMSKEEIFLNVEPCVFSDHSSWHHRQHQASGCMREMLCKMHCIQCSWRNYDGLYKYLTFRMKANATAHSSLKATTNNDDGLKNKTDRRSKCYHIVSRWIHTDYTDPFNKISYEIWSSRPGLRKEFKRRQREP